MVKKTKKKSNNFKRKDDGVFLDRTMWDKEMAELNRWCNE